MTKDASTPKDTATLVLVALSGGVDSAVALRLIQSRYARVEAVSHRHWPESRCCSTACLDGCRSHATEAGVPYQPVDTMVEFAREIVEPFVAAYESGTTPNPCVFCNQKNRFGHMPRKYFENRAGRGLPGPAGFKIATGHYARVHTVEGRPRLLRGRDRRKDQSYMLYRLDEGQRARCLFPLGDLTKSEVRALAAAWGLEAAVESDSQDVCFVENDYRDFLDQYTGAAPATGPYLDKNGNVLGTHRGIRAYTRGQRKGLGLSGGPWFVLGFDLKKNGVVLGSRRDLEAASFRISDCVWHEAIPAGGLACTVETRYHGPVLGCRLSPVDPGTGRTPAGMRWRVELDASHWDVTPGQSAVFYRGDLVLGGGVIEDIE